MLRLQSFPSLGHIGQAVRPYLPGMLMALLVTVLALVLQTVEIWIWKHPIIEALVIAILLGMLIRTVWGLGDAYHKGINFAAKQVLEFAIVLLGASVNLPMILSAGPLLLVGIVLTVVVGLTASVTIGRMIGLNPRLAILVACGNSICGNSAIAAVAPVIQADKEDVVSSIALTAVLGVVVVLSLPLLIPLLSLGYYQYGVLAGLTVYAVPQVLAATFPVSTLSGEVGTLVKLVRVLLLGPVVLFFALRYPQPSSSRRFSLGRFIPWFIVGFLLLGIIRSLGLIPDAPATALGEASRWLTVVAMAALGLSVDVRSLRQVGRPVALAVIGSLLVLLLVSLTVIRVLGITG